jgi:rubrerythrin
VEYCALEVEEMGRRRVAGLSALRQAMERERGASEFYVQAAKLVKEPNGKRAFNWLARQESGHLARLQGQLDSLLESGIWVGTEDTASSIHVGELPASPEARGPLHVNATEVDALRLAMISEREAIAFYETADESTPDLSGKLVYRWLANDERGHLALLERQLEWLSRSGRYFSLAQFRDADAWDGTES